MHAFSAKSLRVYLLDDHDLVRRGLRDLVSAARDITVVGESNAARSAAKTILELGVDVMVLDLHLQDGTGVEVCREVRAIDPSVRGLLLTAASDEEAALAAIVAGAAGYTTKFAHSVDLVGAIRAVGSQRPFMDPELMTRVSALFLASLDNVRPPLTDPERRMLEHVVDGLTDREIADRMGLDAGSVSEQMAALIERTTGLAGRSRGSSSDGPLGRHRRPPA